MRIEAKRNSESRISKAFAALPAIVFFCLVLQGCGATLGTKTPGETASARAVENLIRVPLTRQSNDYSCGVAVLQSILYFHNREDDFSEEDLAKELKPDPDKGTRYAHMASFARSKGYRVDVRTDMTLEDLKRLIDGKFPVIVSIQAWSESPVDYSMDWADGHYVVAVGYDSERVYFMDPSVLGNYAFLPIGEFLERWHDEEDGRPLKHFGMVITREGGERVYDPDRVDRIR